MARYGIYDTKDNCWLGDENGPKLFDDDALDERVAGTGVGAYGLARIAAQLAETQVFGTDMGCRYQAREFNEKNLRKKDTIETKMGPDKALARLEGGE